MLSVLWAQNSFGQNIVECWGFECLYFGTDVWWSWLNFSPNMSFIHYRRQSVFKSQAEKLKKYRNFQDVSDGKDHCRVVKEKWRKSIENSVQLQNINVGAVNREISNSFSELDFEFALEKAELYKGKIVVAGLPSDKKKRKQAKESGKPFIEIEESPSVSLPEIIRMARDKALKDNKPHIAAVLDPDKWFKQFTCDFTFLGRSLKSGQYVHLEMAKLLKAIETEFVKQLGIGDAKKTGDVLLNNSDEGILGSRLTSSTAVFSMHMFGLAVDVNYLGNPYIEKGDIKAVNNVLENAALLMNTEKFTYQINIKGRFADRFDFIQALDTLIENYFKLLDNPAELVQYLRATQSDVWRKLSLEAAQDKIQKNLDNLAGYLARKLTKKEIKDAESKLAKLR